MYAQSTVIRVPIGMMRYMRRLIEQDYLPKLRVRLGFVSAVLLEQEDDEDSAELIVVWESQAAAEEFRRTGIPEATLQPLVQAFPGVRAQRTGYRVSVSFGLALKPEPMKMPAQVN